MSDSWPSPTANKAKFPLPFGDRKSSYIPHNIKPGPIGKRDTFRHMWPLYATGFLAFAMLGAFFAAALIRW